MLYVKTGNKQDTDVKIVRATNRPNHKTEYKGDHSKTDEIRYNTGVAHRRAANRKIPYHVTETQTVPSRPPGPTAKFQPAATSKPAATFQRRLQSVTTSRKVVHSAQPQDPIVWVPPNEGKLLRIGEAIIINPIQSPTDNGPQKNPQQNAQQNQQVIKQRDNKQTYDQRQNPIVPTRSALAPPASIAPTAIAAEIAPVASTLPDNASNKFVATVANAAHPEVPAGTIEPACSACSF